MTTKDIFQVLIKAQNELKESFDELKQGQNELKESFGELEQGQNALKEDFDELKQGQNELKESFGELEQGQNALKQEIAILREETRNGFRETHQRLDKQGKQLAYLDDDAPTREEHDGLVKRVEKIEKVLSS